MDFANAEAAYVHLNTLIPTSDPEHAQIVERIASSIYKQGEQAREAGDYDAAVAHFLRVGKAAPTSPIRATAEYDAAAALIQTGELVAGHRRARGLPPQFPEPRFERGREREARGRLRRGGQRRARGPRISADRRRRRRRGREARGTVAFRRSLREERADGSGGGRLWPVRAALPEAGARGDRSAAKAVDIAAASGNAAERTRWQKEIVAADATAGAERNDRTRYLAAKSQLVLAQPARDAFLGTKLVIPLDKSLKAKQARMKDALAEYGKAADYGVAEVTTAANYEIAELYHSLSKDLLSSQRPRELKKEELEQYDVLLEEQASPFEEQAIKLHEVNAARTADGFYDEWVRKSLAALAELLPARYAKPEIGESLVAAIR